MPRRDERGFTLAEILIAVVIQAIILAALTTALVGTMKNTKSVNQSLDRSSDARIAAYYIVGDARNSSGPEISLGTSTCTDAHPPVAGTATPIVELEWTSTSSAGVDTHHVVDYLLVGTSLLRRECQGASTVSTSDRVVASSVGSVTAACSPVADCSGTPKSITVTVNEVADSNGQVYTYKLTGAFRKLGGAGAPANTNPQSVVLLGSGNSCSGSTDTINISGSGGIRVYGAAYINTTDGASCNAMELSNSGTWQAGSTNIFTGGSCKSPGSWLPCPTVTPFSPRVTDPYASLAAPTTTGLPARTGCAGAQASQTASPGMYASGFDLGGGNTCTLASGIYVIQGGFNVGNGATLKTGAGGVLIYLMSGQFSINGGSNVTFTAMTSGTYSGLVLWQAAADTQPITFSNGGALVFNGAIYAPKAQVQISGNAQTPIVTALVVQTIDISNSGGITVGSPSATPLSISAPASLAAATVNKAYSATVTGAGGDSNYSWSATGLPSGVTMNASTGVISGTPTSTGSSSITVKLSDALGDTPDTQAYTLVVNPAPTISSVVLANKSGGTAGRMEVGDKITIVYSSTMKVSSFCSTWTTGDAANQSLTGNGLLVSVANGTTDVITVANSSGCAFNLGSIDMKSNGYVTAPTTFGGASGNTAVSWTASTKTLVVTLGAVSGTAATVSASTSPVYTASGSIQDANGATLSNSPFTLPAAKQF